MTEPVYRPFVTNIETTVKGPRRDIEIGQRTVVVGKTAAGKSAIGQSLQLVYSGSADGVDGRDNVKGSRLARLAGTGLPLSVEALYSDRNVSAYTMAEGGGRGSLEPAHPDSNEDLAMPVRLVREALGGGDKKAREVFLGWVTSDLDESAILRLVPADVRDTFKQALLVNKGDNPVDSLLSVSQWAAKQKREANSQAKGAQTLLDEIEAPAMPVTDEQVESLREDVTRIRNAISNSEQVTEAAGLYAKLDAALERVANLTTEKADLEMLVSSAQAAVRSSQERFFAESAKKEKAPYPRSFYEAGLTLTKHCEESAASACPTCRGTVEPDGWAQSKKRFADRLDTFSAPSWKDDCPEAEALQQRLRDAETDLSNVKSDIEDANGDVAYSQKRLGELGYDPLDPAPTTVPAADTSGDLKTAEKRLEDAISARSSWKQLEAARTRSRTMRKQAERYKDIEAVCHEIVATLLRNNVGNFVARVSALLPEGWSFSLTLVNETGKDTFEWQVNKGDGRDHFVLSGSEFETVVMALAEAVMQVNDYKGPALIQPADKGWSPRSLTEVTHALSASTCQVLIETTVPPSEEIEGWTYIYLDREPLTTTADTQLRETTDEGGAPTASPQKSTSVPARWINYLRALGWQDGQIGDMGKAEARDIISNNRRGDL